MKLKSKTHNLGFLKFMSYFANAKNSSDSIRTYRKYQSMKYKKGLRMK